MYVCIHACMYICIYSMRVNVCMYTNPSIHTYRPYKKSWEMPRMMTTTMHLLPIWPTTLFHLSLLLQLQFLHPLSLRRVHHPSTASHHHQHHLSIIPLLPSVRLPSMESPLRLLLLLSRGLALLLLLSRRGLALLLPRLLSKPQQQQEWREEDS